MTLSALRIAARRVAGLFKTRRRDAELNDEIQAHLDLLADELVRRGLPPVLATVGLYGVMSYGVACRTSEIGIRMALGANRIDVVSMVLREALWLVTAGVALGIPAALASTRLIHHLLFGLSPTDPLTIGATTTVMFVVAALAASLPARRAARVEPIVALRCA
jgi:ABC-type antimicrobial peptide transport system permease subunit